MSQPAARIGDPTAHGGVIALGFPTVLIGGMPAARITDLHVCPMVTGIVPHVGGPILPPGSPTVLIGNMPAARMGDMATCVGPPDTIIMGCPTVLIGTAGGGSAGSAGAQGAAMAAQLGARMARIDTKASIEKLEQVIEGIGESATVSWGGKLPGVFAQIMAAQAQARADQAQNKESSTKTEHWIEFDFVDAAGLPVSGVSYRFTDPASKESEGMLGFRGMVRRDALPAGQGTVVLMTVKEAKWEKEKARVGENVRMTATVEGFDPGTPALFEVFKRDLTGADVPAATLYTETQADKVEMEWVFAYPEDVEEMPSEDIDAHSAPQYYFDVYVGLARARSGMLAFDDAVEIRLKDREGKPIGNEAYILTFSNGEVRKGKLDANGYKKEENVPPAHWSVKFPDVSGFFQEVKPDLDQGAGG